LHQQGIQQFFMICSHETPKTVENVAQNVQTLALDLCACFLNQPSHPLHETCCPEEPHGQLSDLSETILFINTHKRKTDPCPCQTLNTITSIVPTEDVIPLISLGVSDTTTHWATLPLEISATTVLRAMLAMSRCCSLPVNSRWHSESTISTTLHSLTFFTSGARLHPVQIHSMSQFFAMSPRSSVLNFYTSW
jgi:hypothetical protein